MASLFGPLYAFLQISRADRETLAAVAESIGHVALAAGREADASERIAVALEALLAKLNEPVELATSVEIVAGAPSEQPDANSPLPTHQGA